MATESQLSMLRKLLFYHWFQSNGCVIRPENGNVGHCRRCPAYLNGSANTSFRCIPPRLSYGTVCKWKTAIQLVCRIKRTISNSPAHSILDGWWLNAFCIFYALLLLLLIPVLPATWRAIHRQTTIFTICIDPHVPHDPHRTDFIVQMVCLCGWLPTPMVTKTTRPNQIAHTLDQALVSGITYEFLSFAVDWTTNTTVRIAYYKYFGFILI